MDNTILDTIKSNAQSEVTNYAKEFGLPFWYHNQFCKRRIQEHAGNTCDNCESRVTCCLMHKFFTDAVSLHNQKVEKLAAEIYAKKLQEIITNLKQNYEILKETAERLQYVIETKELGHMENDR